MNNPEPIAGGKAAVKALYEKSSRLAVSPPKAISEKPWLYTDFGQPGEVVESREFSDIGTTFVRFDNGTRLTVRPSEKEKDRVLVNVLVGDGYLDLSPKGPDVSWATDAYVQGGVGRMSIEEVDDALAGKKYGISFGIREDAFVFAGGTRTEDFSTQMQVLAAFVTDPGWRPEGFERIQAQAPILHDQLEASPSGPAREFLPRILRSGDKRFGVPPLEEMQRLTMADLKQAFSPVAEEEIEVVITGDITVDDAIQETARTFGAISQRKVATFPAEWANVRFPAPPSEPVRLTHKGREDQAIAYLIWPTDDISDYQQTREIVVLNGVLRLRLNDEIREAQGVSYSPSAYPTASRAFPGFGYLTTSILAPPANLEPFFSDAEKIAKSLRDKPVTQDELQRAVQPMLETLERNLETNGYWLGALAGAQTDESKLTKIREERSGYLKVTSADVERIAQQYLRGDTKFKLIVVPEGTSD